MITNTPSLLAHRGHHQVHRENTIEAFVAALDLGADGVELDVRHTADGALFVHHDPVEHLAAAALPPHVPTLEAALDACIGALVNIEVKRAREAPGAGDRTSALLVELLRGRRGSDRVVVSSFAPEALDVVVAAAGVETAWLVPALPEALDAPGAAVARGYAGLHPAESGATPALVERAHSLGLAVRVWTVNDPVRARDLAALGVEALITDELAVLLAALA